MLISLELAKSFLRVDADDEDDLIELWIEHAELAVSQYINRKIYSTDVELSEASDESGIVVDSKIKAAMLLLIGMLYEKREVSSLKLDELPRGITFHIDPYRIEMGI
jgi:hypothetical protein